MKKNKTFPLVSMLVLFIRGVSHGLVYSDEYLYLQNLKLNTVNSPPKMFHYLVFFVVSGYEMKF